MIRFELIVDANNDKKRSLNMYTRTHTHTHTHTHTQLLRINHQWDLKYNEQEEAFQQYRVDSQRAQQDIAKLKEDQANEITTLKHELRSQTATSSDLVTLRKELAYYESVVTNLKQRNAELEGHTGGRHGDGRKIKQLEEEIVMLKQQVRYL